MRNHSAQTGELFTEATLENAYQWLCKQRRHFPPNAVIWHLRFHWQSVRPRLLAQLRNHTYRLSPMSHVTKANGDTLHLWSSQDALVLKFIAETLPQHVSLHPACTHIKGYGGLKNTVRQLQRALPEYKFVMKTDVKGYYASIDHTILLKQTGAGYQITIPVSAYLPVRQTNRGAWRAL